MSDGMLTEIDHVAIAVVDLEAAIAWYAEVFGATVAHREVVESDGVEEALLAVADSYVQLLTPVRDDSTVAKYLATKGEITIGTFVTFESAFWEVSYNIAHIMHFIPVSIQSSAAVRHIQYRVADCAAALQSVKDAGGRAIDDAPRPGSRGTTVAFIHPKTSFGTLIELVEE